MAEITKLWIADKMREMMKYKTIDKIRVTEICKAAEIERPTFYYHFKDKYDLVAWMFYHSAYETDVISVKSAAQSMNKMKSDMIFYKRAYEDASQNALWRYMVEYFVARYTELAKERLRTDLLDTQLSYSIRFYCMGAVGMTQEWVLNDNITSAETVVQMMFNSMPEKLRLLFFLNNEIQTI
ncbi:MAG: TetR/AcrR family transcriptional regulator [Clostridiales bacterium]|nr:TetR/AcrR family transcriptional regulator [Clostridiales bacterium]